MGPKKKLNYDILRILPPSPFTLTNLYIYTPLLAHLSFARNIKRGGDNVLEEPEGRPVFLSCINNLHFFQIVPSSNEERMYP